MLVHRFPAVRCTRCQKPLFTTAAASDLRRYLILSATYLQKYVSVFKLHMTKHLMKMDIDDPRANKTFGVNSDDVGDNEGLSFSDEVHIRVKPSDITQFSIPRWVLTFFLLL